MPTKSLPDPIGQVVDRWDRPNGLAVEQVRIPLGVILMIYEARPNVTIEAAALCVKSGNAVILRPGSDALRSSLALAEAFASAGEGDVDDDGEAPAEATASDEAEPALDVDSDGDVPPQTH